MFKILIYFLITTIKYNNIIKVESCFTKSNCQKYTYKKFEPRLDIISQLPDNRKIGHLALVGTHQSMSYALSKNLEVKTQKLSVTDQLRHGIRVLNINVRLQDDKFKIYSNEISLDKTLVDLLHEIERFIHFHPRELVIVIINYDYGWNLSINFDETDPCKKMETYSRVVAGWRLVKNWTLSDTIDKHRGRILLATNEYFFHKCMTWINDKCVNSNNVQTNYLNLYSIIDKVNLKWNQYLKLTENCHSYETYSCFFYDMSIKTDNIHPISDLTKLGYYFDYKCYEPLNYKIIGTARTKCVIALNIFIFDFVTQELIDYINQLNYLKIHNDFNTY